MLPIMMRPKKLTNKFSGKKISIQSWNIGRKIREIDELLIQNEQLKDLFKEAHPEICFKYLNLGNSLSFKKKAPKNMGVEERLNLLSGYDSHVKEAYHKTRALYKSSAVSNDDIADALCLMISARLGIEKGFNTITGSNEKDANDIEMKIHYFDPTSSITV